MDLIEKLLDEDSDGQIRLTNADGTELVFNQVAAIPYNETLFAILAPVSDIEGVNDDEAIVFRVDETDDGETVLVLEEDEETAMAVFDKYIQLWEESQSEGDFDEEAFDDDDDEGDDN
ncbi:MAG: DUF1292 domain-containing protein [Candidatus Coproplasma sp.]